MNLDYTYSQIHHILTGEKIDDNTPIKTVFYDTRRILNGSNGIFFSFKGKLRDGSEFIQQPYDLGVRYFVVERTPDRTYSEAKFTVVDDTLKAIQQLATYHRKRFDIPVIGITGSNGKTIVKEWLSELLEGKYNVVKSPKSYNSQLGVALSLLELNNKANIALIEAGISNPGEMDVLQKMINPTHAIFTHLGTAHLANFESQEALKAEKEKLFESCEWVIAPSGLSVHASTIHPEPNDLELSQNSLFKDKISQKNLSLAVCAAKQLGVASKQLEDKIKEIHGVTMRMEQFDGINGNLIINDTYSLDSEALISSLEHQYAIAQGKKRVVIIGLDNFDKAIVSGLKQIIEPYQPIETYFLSTGDPLPENLSDRVILIKGNRSANMEVLANKLRLRNHQSFLEIDLEAIRKNINTYSDHLPNETKLLCMVKASSYGSDATKIGTFLTRLGVDYLGVAYTDEGVELRNAGVTLPILVMNADIHSFGACIENNLEPAIFSITQLEELVKELIARNQVNYPIHIKLETGMHRLGFEERDLKQLISYLKAQPEVYIKSVYSHLATADDPINPFAQTQIDAFEKLSSLLEEELPYGFMKHILNSEGAASYPNAAYDMVRLGIGMYGISSNVQFQDKLTPCFKWKSSVSQVKNLDAGDTLGYGQAFMANKPMQTATIPVGYADGFRRSLGNSKGSVFINGAKCPVLGNVCMDMIMVDVTGLNVSPGDAVEIIGSHCSIQNFAQLLETIPYEVLTSFSQRLPRVYIND
ncbi:MAG: alanine racemase [Crocinitomicaceae bacterium]